jgi:hypothetical protein
MNRAAPQLRTPSAELADYKLFSSHSALIEVLTA